MQLRTKRRLNLFIAISAGAILALFGSQKKVEAVSVDQYISQLAPMNFNPSGAVSVPNVLLDSLGNNQIDPVLQFVLMNSIVNQASKNAIQQYPGRRASYQEAMMRFQNGICLIQKAFQSALLLTLLPQMMAANQAASQYGGGSSNSNSGALLAATFTQGKGCDGSSGGGIDQGLASAFGSAAGSSGASSPGLGSGSGSVPPPVQGQ